MATPMRLTNPYAANAADLTESAVGARFAEEPGFHALSYWLSGPLLGAGGSVWERAATHLHPTRSPSAAPQ